MLSNFISVSQLVRSAKNYRK